MSEEKLQSAIDALYDAALAERPWHEAMEQVRQLFGSVAVNLEIIDKRLMQPIFICDSGIPPESITRYLEEFSDSCPRVLHGAGWKPGHIGFDSQILSETDMDKDPFYQELLRPDDMRYFMSATLSNSTDEYGVLAIQRSANQGHVNADDVNLLKRIAPQVVRAVSIARRLGPVSGTSAPGTLLDQSSTAIFFLDVNGAIVSKNKAANELIETYPKAIKTLQDRLHFSGAAFKQFEKALAKALAPSATASAFTLGANPNTPLSAYITPLEKNQSTAVMPLSARVAVLLSFQTSRSDLLRALLAQTYDLTRRQRDLSIALLLGHSLESFAQQHDLSLATVRTHLARVREKTGTHTQAELVSKLHQLTPRLL